MKVYKIQKIEKILCVIDFVDGFNVHCVDGNLSSTLESDKVTMDTIKSIFDSCDVRYEIETYGPDDIALFVDPLTTQFVWKDERLMVLDKKGEVIVNVVEEED